MVLGGGEGDGEMRRGVGTAVVVAAIRGVAETGEARAAAPCSGEDTGRRGGVTGGPRGTITCQQGTPGLGK